MTRITLADTLDTTRTALYDEIVGVERLPHVYFITLYCTYMPPKTYMPVAVALLRRIVETYG